ncbi:MAG: hypothetical protein M3Z97_04750 [Candidatus Dormibacteraeota bacterium]|nr:hypothetical protein [Candidatus Dormibacteraeota bacterium]
MNKRGLLLVGSVSLALGAFGLVFSETLQTLQAASAAHWHQAASPQPSPWLSAVAVLAPAVVLALVRLGRRLRPHLSSK